MNSNFSPGICQSGIVTKNSIHIESLGRFQFCKKCNEKLVCNYMRSVYVFFYLVLAKQLESASFCLKIQLHTFRRIKFVRLFLPLFFVLFLLPSVAFAGPLDDSNTAIDAKMEALTPLERLPPKIQKIQTELPVWIQNADNIDTATALSQRMQEYPRAKNFEEAAKTADSILKIMDESAQAAAPHIPEETRRKLVHGVGSSFLVFVDKIQEELKVTKEQKEKLDQYLGKLLPDAMQLLQKIKGLTPRERETYHQKTREEMAAVLQEILNDRQRKRLRQVELQREGLFGEGWNWKDLQVTDEERKQFVAEIQQTQKNNETLMEEIRNGANPNEIRPKVLKNREELEGRLEALLTNAQKKQWKEMLGKPIELGVLFDLSSH
jgi:hypothetical protein